MEIIIAATKNCPHRQVLENELQIAWLPFKTIYFEDQPEVYEKYQIRHSPLLIVDEKVESIGMPEKEKIDRLKEIVKDISELRAPKKGNNHMIPNSLNIEPISVEVDITWGRIQPIQAAEAVLTIGEHELFHHKKKGFTIIDTRTPNTTGKVSIPGSKNIPYDELVKRMTELDINHPSIFFCNGPQCPQSPKAIRNLLDAGHPAEKILYYRGGMHDWITLGLPVQRL